MKWARIAHDRTFSQREAGEEKVGTSFKDSSLFLVLLAKSIIPDNPPMATLCMAICSHQIQWIFTKFLREQDIPLQYSMPIHWWLASWTFFYPEPIQLSLRVQMVSINDKLTDEPTCLDAAFWCCLKRWSNMAPYSSWIRCISFMCSATFEARK